MVDIYDRMQATARRLLAPTNQGGLGQGDIRLVRYVPAALGPHPWSPPAPPTRQVTKLYGAARGVTKELIGAPVQTGGQIVATDMVVTVAPWGGDYDPADVLEIDGRPVTVLKVEDLPAAGTVCAVRFVARGGAKPRRLTPVPTPTPAPTGKITDAQFAASVADERSSGVAAIATRRALIDAGLLTPTPGQTVTLLEGEFYSPPGSSYGVTNVPWGPLYNDNTAGHPEYAGTSNTPNTIGAGAKTFTLNESGKDIELGRWVKVLADPTDPVLPPYQNMEGPITAWDGDRTFTMQPTPLRGNTSAPAPGTGTKWIVIQFAKAPDDYAMTAEIDPANIRAPVTIRQTFSQGGQIGGANSFGGPVWGDYNLSSVAIPVNEMRVNRIVSLRANCAFTINEGPQSANVLYEFYTRRNGALTAEVGWFLHAPDSTRAFVQGERQVLAAFTDEQGMEWRTTAYPGGDAGKFIMSLAPDGADRQGQIEAAAMLRALVDAGEIDGNDRIRGTGLGSEGLPGASSVTLSMGMVAEVLPDGVPGFILRLAVTDGIMSFQEPADFITGYQYRIDGGAPAVLPSNRTLPTLTNGQHTLQVRGVNGANQGEWSRAVTFTAGTVVQPPAANNLITGAAATNPTQWAPFQATTNTTGLRETADAGEHRISRTITGLPSAAGDYLFRARVKADGRDWAVLHVFAGSYNGDHRRFFNVATGAIGETIGGGSDLTLVDSTNTAAPDGYRDIAIRVTKAAGITSLDLRLGTADADGATWFAGDPAKGLLASAFTLEAL